MGLTFFSLAVLLPCALAASPGGPLFTQEGSKMTAQQQELPDFAALWNFTKPADTEARFRALDLQAARSGNRAYLLELRTQIARAEGLQGKYEAAHATLD